MTALLRLVRDPERREFLAGDLEEEFARRASRESVGAARRWYLSQVLRSLLALGRAAVPGAGDGPTAAPGPAPEGDLAAGARQPAPARDRLRVGRRPGASEEPATGLGRRRAELARSIDAVAADLRDALRGLRASPGPTLVVAATLALGVGANTAMFGIADAVLFRPLPHPEPDRLPWIHAAGPGAGDRYEALTWQDVERLRDADVGLETVGGYSSAGRTLQVPGIDPLEIDFARVTEGFFEALGAEVAPGRPFTRGELRAGAPVVVLSHAFWREELGGDAGVVGSDVAIRRMRSLVDEALARAIITDPGGSPEASAPGDGRCGGSPSPSTAA